MKLGERMLNSALFFVTNLSPEKNVFASKPTFLRRMPLEARTLCSTFISHLAKEQGSPINFGSYASEYFNSSVPTVLDITNVKPGMLLTIKFSTLLNGYTGHCAMVAGNPVELGNGEWLVKIVDSTGTPHGPTDTRFQGIGIGYMVLITDGGMVSGYRWSRSAQAHYNKDGARMVRIANLNSYP